MSNYDYQIRVETLGYKPRGKAGKHCVHTSWRVSGQPTTRNHVAAYFATRAAAEAFAQRQRDQHAREGR
jgi:hypothetical protein